MARRKGQNRRFPLNAYLEIKINQKDVQLACALANDKNYVAKLKRLQSKVGCKKSISCFSYEMLIFQFVICYDKLSFNLLCS